MKLYELEVVSNHAVKYGAKTMDMKLQEQKTCSENMSNVTEKNMRYSVVLRRSTGGRMV